MSSYRAHGRNLQIRSIDILNAPEAYDPPYGRVRNPDAVLRDPESIRQWYDGVIAALQGDIDPPCTCRVRGPNEPPEGPGLQGMFRGGRKREAVVTLDGNAFGCVADISEDGDEVRESHEGQDAAIEDARAPRRPGWFVRIFDEPVFD